LGAATSQGSDGWARKGEPYGTGLQKIKYSYNNLQGKKILKELENKRPEPADPQIRGTKKNGQMLAPG